MWPSLPSIGSNSKCKTILYIHGLILFGAAMSTTAYQNVYGNDLQSCSSDGMALTGYTRSGYCTDQNDDSGSHHICIDLSTNTGGNFCEVTGQSDWCSSEMACHGGDDDGNNDDATTCPVQNWCVCQWAFASYLQLAGGCDYIQDIVCESINIEAVKAYKNKQGVAKYDNALSCLADRCGLTVSNTSLYGVFTNHSGGDKRFYVFLAGCVAAAALLVYRYRTQRTINDSHVKELFVSPQTNVEMS